MTGEPDQLEPKPLASTVPLKIDDSRKKNDLMNKVEEAKEGEYSSEPEKGQSTNKKLMAEHIKNMKNPTYVPCDKLWYASLVLTLLRVEMADYFFPK